MQGDFESRLNGLIDFQEDDGKLLGRFYDVKFKANGSYTYKDITVTSEQDLIDSISIIIDNSGYDAEYLKRCYFVEFYQILYNIKAKLEKDK